ncbi:MAG: adenosylmethionine--8-amino-7-oxononanoate transaminase [Sphingobacteriaceae bacterium]
MQSWITRDVAVNWHPYSQMKTSRHLPIERGAGAYLYDTDGKGYLDMICSWWVTLHGHAQPYIAEKVYQQLTTLEQVIFAGFTHPGAIHLSERLLALLPQTQQKVFYSDNGSTAVEVALKMCIQYWSNQGRRKNKILALRNGYHGDTFGAMAVSERGQWTAPFSDLLFEVIFIDAPTEENFSSNRAIVEAHADQLACFIYEPLVQGAGGMLMHQAADLSNLMNLCRSLGVLMIQDEVFVGFGRTGSLFAANQLSESPDLMCFSKGLTGGTMPMGITTCCAQIYEAFYDDDKKRALFHGHSFTASPIACAASLASMDLLLQPETQSRIDRIGVLHQKFMQELMHNPAVENLRRVGTIMAFDWQGRQKNAYFNNFGEWIAAHSLKRNLILRPLGNVLYLLPPYCISDQELEYTYQSISEMLDEISG